MSARWLVWLLACACTVACGSDPEKLTQIVVVVSSDLRVPAELDALSISVEGALNMPEATVSLTAVQGFPRSLGLVHAGGPLGPVRVSVRGRHADALVVERSAEVRFQTGRTLKLALSLARACANAELTCEASETCVDGACAPRAIANLPAFDGKLTGVAGAGSAGRGGSGAAAGGGGRGASAGQGGGGAAAQGGGGAGGSVEPNQPPSCSIESPVEADRFYEGDTVSFKGSCSDPEDGNLQAVRWRSSRDGSLGVLTQVAVSALSAGEHTLTLCAADPADENVTGCAGEVHVTVQPLPAITATIKSVSQAGSTSGPFSTNGIQASGEGSGVEPLTFTWIDSIAGEIGTDAQVTLSAPVQAGKHTLVLRVTDARDRSVMATQTFTVLPPGKMALFEAYGVVNSVLSNSGGLTALAANGGTVHMAAGAGVVYGFDATSNAGTTSPALELTTAPDAVQDISVHTASGNAYISTNAGVRACALSGNSIGNTCTTYKDMPLPGNDVRTSVRVTAGGTEYLLAGTTAGLLIAQANNVPMGAKTRPEVVMSRAVVGAVYVWMATSAGLSSYELSKTISGAPRTYSNSPTNLTSLTLASSIVWVGSGAGLARYEVASLDWTTWNINTEAEVSVGRLVSNEVRTLTFTHPTIAGTARDVIWIGTNAGVSRYDTDVQSFTTYTTDDGLPSNSVRAIVKLDTGELVFGTDAGLAIYRGL